MIDSSQGMTSDHYSFDPDSSSTIPMLFASGTGADYDYHGAKQRGGGNLQLSGIDTPTCICNTGVHGSLDGVPFNKNCLPEPSADLVQQVWYFLSLWISCIKSLFDWWMVIWGVENRLHST